jgi:hypothetical protein
MKQPDSEFKSPEDFKNNASFKSDYDDEEML